jgi:MoxR-like ATPase
MSDIWGKQGLKVSSLDENNPVSVTEFVSGPLTKAIQEGTGIVIDELNILPKDGTIDSIIKAACNAKAGSPVSIPGNGFVTKHENFHAIATANLKSDKNPTRGDIEPQIRREFQKIPVEYHTAQEAYDVVLSWLGL